MWFRSILDSFDRSPRRRAQRPAVRKRQSRRLYLEALEDRRLLAFDLAVDYAVGYSGSALAAADLDGDGLVDLGPIGSVGLPGINALLGNGDGTFRHAQLLVIGTYDTPIVANLNGDAIDDLVKINMDDLDLVVQLGNGDGTYQESQAIVLPSQLPPSAGFHPSQSPTLITLGDLNADGQLDLVAVGFDEELIDDGWDSRRDHYVNVLLGSGDGTFGQISSYYVTSTISSEGWADASVLGVRDFDGDGQADILTTLDAVRLFSGNGDGTLQIPASFFRGAWPGDVNADGVSDRVDLVYQGSSTLDDNTTRHSHVRLGNGDGSFAPALISDLGRVYGVRSGVVTGLADFDADGLPELVVSEFNTLGNPYRMVSVAHNNGIWTAPPPSITVSDVTVVEGNTGTRVATFTVILSAPSNQPVTVSYATADGNATGGSDYQAASGTLTIPTGQTTGTITVLVNGDRIGEANETFFVNLSSPTNATIGDSQGLGTIVDDEPGLSIGDVAKKEGKKNQTTLFTFTVILSAAYDQPVKMSFGTMDGTAKTSGGDYVAKLGTLTFAPGETTKTITIEVKGDSKKEDNETFYVDLFDNSGNSRFTKNRGIGTIFNDD